MSDVVVGVTYSGDKKDYVLDKFLEMAEVCIRPYADILWVGQALPDERDTILYMDHPNDNTEDILMIARDKQRLYAKDVGYGKLVWQGVDCLYQSADDFKKLVSHDVCSVGAITCARSNSLQAVAAQYIETLDGWDEMYTHFSEWVLDSGKMIAAGIPGADAMVLRHDCLDIDWWGKHKPWYDRRRDGEWEIAAEAWYALQLMRRGQTVWLDTSIKTWHVHEDRVARMWKGIEKPLYELKWS